jgi:hypothetical protein
MRSASLFYEALQRSATAEYSQSVVVTERRKSRFSEQAVAKVQVRQQNKDRVWNVVQGPRSLVEA